MDSNRSPRVLENTSFTRLRSPNVVNLSSQRTTTLETPQSDASDYYHNKRDTPKILRTRNLDSPLLLHRQDIELNNLSPIVLHKVQQLSFFSTCLSACQDEEEPDDNYTDDEYDDENIPPPGYDSAKPSFDPRLKSKDREPLAELDLEFYKNSHQCLVPPNQLRAKKIYRLTPDDPTKPNDSEIKERPIPFAIFSTPIESTTKESYKTEKIKRKIRTPGSSKSQSARSEFAKSEPVKIQNSPFLVWEDPDLRDDDNDDEHDSQEEFKVQDHGKKMEIYDSPFVRRLRSVIFEGDDDDEEDANSDNSISHLIDQSTPTHSSNNQKSPLASLTPIAAKSIFWNEDL
ncbi:3633_t:CDS:2 [Ambispora leptoticha]|uniref:3633_t:CDS:1 n=1 Tax=Ambispora leptoticha TaxID=144679 RepID=A0A9N9F715_9GLOM|nr:3633_t:CDS:2 [Ambispora leptoticha]